MEKINVLRQDIAFRLSLWYALILLLLFTISFISFFFLAKTRMGKKAEKEVLSYVDECKSIFQSEGLEGLRKDFLLETHASGEGKSVKCSEFQRPDTDNFRFAEMAKLCRSI